jgi:signal transduction histidine kinase
VTPTERPSQMLRVRDDDGVRRPSGAQKVPRRATEPTLADWGLGVLVGLAHLTLVRAGQVETLVAAGWAEILSGAFAVGAGLAVVWRRVHRRAVAAGVVVCFAGLSLVGGILPAWAPWVVIWSLATTGPNLRRSMRESAVVAGATVVVLVLAQLVHPRSGGLVLVASVTAVVALVGVLVHSERARVDEAGRRATVEERLRIARDLHDLVGHGLSAVAIQSSTARMAITDGDTATAERALTAIETTSRTAMREMRQMLALLTDEVGADVSRDTPSAPSSEREAPGPDSARAPSPGVADIAALVENVRAGAVTVMVEDDGRWRQATRAAQLCAYRLAQEGLTNAVRHAPGAAVTVTLSAVGNDGRVSVLTAAPVTSGEGTGHGRGLRGLRTRVAALSGEFWSGPTPQGWLVEARLPLDAEATEGDTA